MKCPKCGKEIAEDSQFCEYCGAKINFVPTNEKKPKNYKPLWISLAIGCASVIGWGVYNQYENVQIERAETRQKIYALERQAEELKRLEKERQAEELRRKVEKKRQEEERIRKEKEERKRQEEANWPKENGMLILSDSNFDDFISLSFSKPVIVDFYADWCPACRRMTPTMINLAKGYNSKLIIGRYDIEKGSIKKDEYNVSSIPNIYFIKNGQILKLQIGSCEESKMKSLIKETFGL